MSSLTIARRTITLTVQGRPVTLVMGGGVSLDGEAFLQTALAASNAAAASAVEASGSAAAADSHRVAAAASAAAAAGSAVTADGHRAAAAASAASITGAVAASSGFAAAAAASAVAANAAFTALTTMEVMHLLAQGSYSFPVPSGWWDTGLRQTATDSLRGATSTLAIISNWNADGLRGIGPNLFFLADDTARGFGADGVTQVSAPGTAVSIVTDDWQGLQLGPELVTNGGFDTDLSGWAETAAALTVAWEAPGRARITRDASAFSPPQAFQSSVPVVAGRAYRIAFTSGGGPVAREFTNVVPATFGLEISGTVARIVVANAASIALRFWPDPSNSTTIDDVSVREVLNWPGYQNTAAARPTWGRAPAQVRNLWSGGSDAPVTGGRTVTAVQHVLSFTGTGSVARSGASTGTLAGTGINDRVQAVFTPTAGTLTLTITGDVRNLQLETGGAATAYQSRGVTPTDITEAGVRSFGVLSFDGSDDALIHQLSAGGTVAVALFGRAGSYLIPSITLAAPSVLTLGPISVLDDGVLVSGCPTGILRAVGSVPWSSRLELVGYAIMKANPSAEEQARAMRYFASHGARGWLNVEGPDIAPNGTFDVDVAGWTGVLGTPVWDAGRIRINNATGQDPSARFRTQAVIAKPNTLYRVRVDLVALLGDATQAEFRIGNASLNTSNPAGVRVLNVGSNDFLLAASGTAMGTFGCIQLGGAANGPGGAIFDNIIINEMFPEF